MAMLLQENSTHAFKYMYVKYRTAPFFLRCHLGPQYQYLGLCLAPVNACNSSPESKCFLLPSSSVPLFTTLDS